jgi:D-amino-acid oxidase
MAVDEVVVVGAGVVGLTTAIALAEVGVPTRVVAAEPPTQVTSVAAGAIWGPVTCGPDDRCYEWSRTGLEVLSALAQEPGAGVHPLHGLEVMPTETAPPEWMDLLSDVRILDPGELPLLAEGGRAVSGWTYTAPAVNMPVYLEYLLNRYAGLGGTVGYAAVPSLAAVDAGTVVNCTGIGARALVGDDSLVPIRGQVVVAENPGIEEFYIAPGDRVDDYVYAFPHGDVIVLGGTAHHGAFDLAPRPEISARILRDAAAVSPRLRGARVITERVGLRPYRPEVRLEAETLPDGRTLWHNYGHGGAGVTLSWGCAREITSAVLAGEGGARDRSVEWI